MTSVLREMQFYFIFDFIALICVVLSWIALNRKGSKLASLFLIVSGLFIVLALASAV